MRTVLKLCRQILNPGRMSISFLVRISMFGGTGCSRRNLRCPNVLVNQDVDRKIQDEGRAGFHLDWRSFYSNTQYLSACKPGVHTSGTLQRSRAAVEGICWCQLVTKSMPGGNENGVGRAVGSSSLWKSFLLISPKSCQTGLGAPTEYNAKWTSAVAKAGNQVRKLPNSLY